MSMGEIKWYPRYMTDALAGMIGLPLEERGAYNSVLDLIYLDDDQLIDDDRIIATRIGCDARKWRHLKKLLIGLGKLHVDDGCLRNRRATTVLRSIRTPRSTRGGSRGGSGGGSMPF